jgi:hypothetical protein
MLKQLSEIFYAEHGNEISRLTFVFPNRRAGLFFKKYLSETAGKPLFAPEILTVNELFYKINPARVADDVKLLFMIYEIYCRQSRKNETFDNFFYWGEMLLKDFDDIDRNMVDARQLFTNIKDINSIGNDYSFLSETQIKAIRSFWSTFEAEKDDAYKDFFLNVWEILFPIYSELRQQLSADGLAYEGMIFRDTVEHFDRLENSVYQKFSKIIFVGLNALSKTETGLLERLKNMGIADFYWDYSSEMLCDPDNRASLFMKENMSRFPSAYSIRIDERPAPVVETIGAPSRIGQAKLLYSLLSRDAACNVSTINDADALKTAIVLPDEQLLMPVLNSIPEEIRHINVTLGYSLVGSPVAALMEHLCLLQKNARRTGQDVTFYHRDVKATLKHRYISSICPNETAAIIYLINKNNYVTVPASELCKTPLLQLIFSVSTNAREMSTYLINVLKALNRHFSTSPKTDVSHALEQEFIYRYFIMVNRMNELLVETKMEMSNDTYFRLLKQMTAYIKIPFQGEPLSGLQIMGVLETRLLDFDNIIILSCNEGVFPASGSDNSFIPYNLRRGFGLPAREHTDSVRAYHFYSMISRARHVCMIYDTRTDGLRNGEISRFVLQLKYHYNMPVRERLAVYNIPPSQVEPIIVVKDDLLIKQMVKYEDNRALSASAINTYLDCPLKFYLTEIKEIRETDDVSEDVENDDFGTILHSVMEQIYKPLCGKNVTAELIQAISHEKNVTAAIQTAFAANFFHSKELRPLTGRFYLYGQTIRKYVGMILDFDSRLAPFTYVQSEKPVNGVITLLDGRNIKLKGFIDRIDGRSFVSTSTGKEMTLNAIRIVDYKTGKPSSLDFPSIASLFDKTAKNRKKAIFQVFLYSWLNEGHNEGLNINVTPAIYYVRDMYRLGDYSGEIRLVGDDETNTDNITINNFNVIRDDFENALRQCVSEIFDRTVPFTQTTVNDNCS